MVKVVAAPEPTAMLTVAPWARVALAARPLMLRVPLVLEEPGSMPAETSPPVI